MKKSMLFLLLIALIVSCNQPGKINTGNTKLVQEYFNYFNKHQWRNMAAMYSDTAWFKDPSFGTGLVKQSRQQVVEKYSALQKTFTDIKDSVVKIYPSSDKHVIVEFISSGTAPDGSKFQLPVCTIFTFEKRIITGDFTYYDNFEEHN